MKAVKPFRQSLIQLKDTYIVLFSSMRIADYWRTQFALKYRDQIVIYGRYTGLVELNDQIWYFKSEQSLDKMPTIRGTILPQESIYIILDDPERKRLDTYEGE